MKIKFYEREKKIRLNFLRQQKYFFQRTRASIFEEVQRIQLKKEHELFLLSHSPSTSSWTSQRPKRVVPSFFITNWEENSSEIQSEIVLPTINTRPPHNRPQSVV